MRQQTLASQASFEEFGCKGKRELLLDPMQPVGLAIMLRTYFLQQWFNLSDPGMEEEYYDSPALRRFS